MSQIITAALAQVAHFGVALRRRRGELWLAHSKTHPAFAAGVAAVTAADLELLRDAWRALNAQPEVPVARESVQVPAVKRLHFGAEYMGGPQERTIDDRLTNLDLLRENHVLRNVEAEDDLMIGSLPDQLAFGDDSDALSRIFEGSASTADYLAVDYVVAKQRPGRRTFHELRGRMPVDPHPQERIQPDESEAAPFMGRKASTHRKPIDVDVTDDLGHGRQRALARDALVQETIDLAVELLLADCRWEEAEELEDAWVRDGVLLAWLLPDECVISAEAVAV